MDGILVDDNELDNELEGGYCGGGYCGGGGGCIEMDKLWDDDEDELDDDDDNDDKCLFSFEEADNVSFNGDSFGCFRFLFITFVSDDDANDGNDDDDPDDDDTDEDDDEDEDTDDKDDAEMRRGE